MSGTDVGFVGIGQIGFPIAARLVDSGFDVTAFDLRGEALASFEGVGGHTAGDAASVARGADVVHVAVVTDEQVDDVVRGGSGVFAGFEASGGGGSVVVHTTVVPGTVRALAEDAPPGVDVIDAAVSGGYPRAEEGDLTLMVGGDDDAVDGHADALEAIAREVHRLGAVGNGMATKLLNNAILHAQEVATFEAVEFGKAYGLDEADMVSVFEQGTATNSAVQRWEYVTRRYFETHPRGPYGGVENARKNMKQMLEMANAADAEVPMAGLVSQLAPRMKRTLADRVAGE